MINKKSYRISRLGFSLIELSVVILVIGLLVIGITQGSRIINEAKLKSARSLTANSPMASTDGLILWLESTGEKAFQTANGSNNLDDGSTVATWNDINPQTPNKFQATEPTNRPIFELDGINHLPSLYFSCPAGANASCPKLSIPFNASLNTSDQTIFVVTNTTAMISTYNGVIIYSAGGPGGFSIYKSSSNWNMKSYSSGGSATPLSNYPNNLPVILTFKRNSSTVNVYQNSASTASSFSISYAPATSGSLLIGLNNVNEGYNGYISEIIYFNRILKSYEITNINGYLSNKYGIKIN